MSCRNIDGSSGSIRGFSLPNTVIVTTTGSYTSSLNVQYIEVYAIGGGGGGGGGGSRSGCGGGASCPSVKFFAPGTYAITIGNGGGGNLPLNNGANGIDTNFGGGLLISKTGQGGDHGSQPSPQGGICGAEDVTALFSLGRSPGMPDGNIRQAGCGGSNYFGTGGRAFFNTSANVDGESASGFGAGGAGGTGSGGQGGNGSKGAVIIIEHF